MAENPYFVTGMPEDITKDHIVRGEALGGLVKCSAIRTTLACETARQLHDTSPAATAALGRFLTGSLLISESMKRPTDTQTTILRGDGPLGGMTCVTDFGFKCRAYPVENNIPTEYHKPGKINVGAAVGNGTLTVVRDLGLKDPYVGSVELISGEIAEDFACYLLKSEQVPSIVALGVLLNGGKVAHAGGFMAQIMDLFMGDPDMKYLDAAEVSFECTCSRERMSAGLAALSKADLEDLISEGKPVETCCRFCNKKYVFGTQEISDFLKNR